MKRMPLRQLILSLCAIVVSATAAFGQDYFGRNKVQYKDFDWRIIRSEHFDSYFYPPESLAVYDAARQAERWYARHSDTFKHAFDRKSLIFYAAHPDFEQTNVVGESPEEGIGGETEGMRTRVIMPFTGIYADNDHVLGHELVHVFQYNIAEAAPGGGLQRMDQLPGWLIEGMAEYLSLGREDPLTAMWMRDAILRNRFPTIKQLTTDPRFFPYRYGQALWAYIGGRWGDRSIVDIYRAALRVGWNSALVRVLGEDSDSLSKDWAAANRALYLPMMAGKTHPDSVGARIVAVQGLDDYNLAPAISPDGKYFAYFSSRDLFGIDLYLADAVTGKLIKKLAGQTSDRHFDAISFVSAAGDWSPDSKKFAFIATVQGNNQIAIVDARSTNIERRIQLPGVGGVSSVSWSPDGKTLAIAGQAGGLSDLYLLDLDSGKLRQVTHDRYADLQPTWSPDGKTIAFVTDRGPSTDFELLKYSPLQVALMDVASGSISLLAPFGRGMDINPQFSPDGKQLYFVSNQDGYADIYRMDLQSRQLFRLTHTPTGVSGITTESPTMTVSRQSGEMMFTTFYNQGWTIRAFTPAQLEGDPVQPTAAASTPAAATTTITSVIAATTASGAPEVTGATLPPAEVAHSLVSSYLADPTTGLPSNRPGALSSVSDFQVVDFHPAFSLDAIGNSGAGVVVGGTYGGPGLVGGVAALWGDQLGDRQIYTAIQANGTVKDIGGEVNYMNLRRRWNWGVGIAHIPYLTGGSTFDQNGTGPSGYNENDFLERIFIDQAQVFAQYPFTSTQRFEASGAVTHYAFNLEQITTTVINGVIVNQTDQTVPSGIAPFTTLEPSVALVGDNSFAAFTSPVVGMRYRLQFTPTFGTTQYETALADARKYFFFRPFTLAFRGYSLGRYGRDAENNQLLWPFYLGEETWIRGYGIGSFTADECSASASSGVHNCPQLDRLFGSKVAVANAEFRIPLFGVPEFGLINFPFLPTEIAPFFDAGMAYTNQQQPDFSNFSITHQSTTVPASCANDQSSVGVTYGCADRIPVFSTGLSMRFNLMGYLILEAYYAHPFQRPTKSWVWGFQIAPGW